MTGCGMACCGIAGVGSCKLSSACSNTNAFVVEFFSDTGCTQPAVLEGQDQRMAGGYQIKYTCSTNYGNFLATGICNLANGAVTMQVYAAPACTSLVAGLTPTSTRTIVKGCNMEPQTGAGSGSQQFMQVTACTDKTYTQIMGSNSKCQFGMSDAFSHSLCSIKQLNQVTWLQNCEATPSPAVSVV